MPGSSTGGSVPAVGYVLTKRSLIKPWIINIQCTVVLYEERLGRNLNIYIYIYKLGHSYNKIS